MQCDPIFFYICNPEEMAYISRICYERTFDGTAIKLKPKHPINNFLMIDIMGYTFIIMCRGKLKTPLAAHALLMINLKGVSFTQ